MKVVVGEILPLALVVTISPLNIIPAILLLFTTRPLVNALSFVSGFLVGVAGVLVLATAIAGSVDLGSESGHSTWAGALKLRLGAYLLVAAVRKFRGRPKAGHRGRCPVGWMGSPATRGAGHSALYCSRAVNPKNVVVGLAAAVTIAGGGLSLGQQIVVSAIYVLVASLGVAAPIVVTLFLGDKAPEVLGGWNLSVAAEQCNSHVRAVRRVRGRVDRPGHHRHLASQRGPRAIRQEGRTGSRRHSPEPPAARFSLNREARSVASGRLRSSCPIRPATRVRTASPQPRPPYRGSTGRRDGSR